MYSVKVSVHIAYFSSKINRKIHCNKNFMWLNQRCITSCLQTYDIRKEKLFLAKSSH